MSETPRVNENVPESDPVTVSERIRNAYAAVEGSLVHGEHVFLADYERMKTEVRDILAKVGLWSAEIDNLLDKNLLYLGGLSRGLESTAKWMTAPPSNEREEKLRHYREHALIHLRKMEMMTPQWESWIQTGSPEDLQKVGENLYYMSRVFGLVGPQD